MKRIISLGSLALVIISLSACTKVEGEGGSSSISGVVHANVYDGANNLLTHYDAPEEDVYIVYGGTPDPEVNYMYNDDQKTSYGGNFTFDYLERGNYAVFVYEKCNTCPSGKKLVMEDVEITEKKQEILLDTIFIRK